MSELMSSRAEPTYAWPLGELGELTGNHLVTQTQLYISVMYKSFIVTCQDYISFHTEQTNSYEKICPKHRCFSFHK